MKKITHIEDLVVGTVIYLHDYANFPTVYHHRRKVLILEDSYKDNTFGIIITPILDLTNNSKDYFCPKDYNIIPNNYNDFFATTTI